jgi:hypothetical protein
MTEMLPASILAARRYTALAARRQLDALAAADEKADQEKPAPAAKRIKRGRYRVKTERAARALRPSRYQRQWRANLGLALAQLMVEWRTKGHRLIFEGLRLLAADERQQALDAAMQKLDDLEQWRLNLQRRGAGHACPVPLRWHRHQWDCGSACS